MGTSKVNWQKAIIAGVAATIIFTITLALTGTNIIKMLGGMMLGSGAGTPSTYVLGGMIHLMIGIFYAIVFAAVVASVESWGKLTKGAAYGLALSAIAMAVIPILASMMGGGGEAVSQPCNPCNPCNPCGGAMANPCNPCAGGEANPFSLLISVVNHIVYGLVLAYLYKGPESSASE